MEWNIFDNLPSLSVLAASKLKKKLQKYLDSSVLDSLFMVGHEPTNLLMSLSDGLRLFVYTWYV